MLRRLVRELTFNKKKGGCGYCQATSSMHSGKSFFGLPTIVGTGYARICPGSNGTNSDCSKSGSIKRLLSNSLYFKSSIYFCTSTLQICRGSKTFCPALPIVTGEAFPMVGLHFYVTLKFFYSNSKNALLGKR